MPLYGAWRSLVSALVWGTRGPRFESGRPDFQEAKAPDSGVFCCQTWLRTCVTGRRYTDTDAWGGPVATRYVGLVLRNEPVERLALRGERLRAALT